jgi:adenosylhomocysteinase
VTPEEYYWCIEQVLKTRPNITVDDGADLIFTLHEKHPELIENIFGGTEETTTGVHRLRAMANVGKLKYPLIAVNDAETKWDFDNVYGTGQSAVDGIIRATNILIAGSNFVVAGYGHCGRGISLRARGMGAHVIVTEVDPIRALRAKMDGYDVMPMMDAVKVGDVIVTATGCKDVVNEKHIREMKNGAILANAGHFNVEVSVSDLERSASRKKEMRSNNVEYTLKDGRRIYLLAEGRLVNLVAAEGHPPEVMDMSFSNQFKSILYLAENRKLKPGVYSVPREQDEEIARIKLMSMGVVTDELSEEQEKYLSTYNAGT